MNHFVQRLVIHLGLLVVAVLVAGKIVEVVVGHVGRYAVGQPAVLLLGLLFFVGLFARARATRRDPRRELQRRQVRRWVDDMPVHTRPRPQDRDPVLPINGTPVRPRMEVDANG